MATSIYASVVDPVEGNPVAVKKTGEMKVEASVPSTVNVSVQGTADVNVASCTSAPLPTTPGAASSIEWDQVDVDATAGGTAIGGGQSALGIKIANLDATRTVFLGFGGSTLTTTNGYPLAPGNEFTLPSNVGTDSVQIKGITASGTARVAYVKTR